MMKQGLLSWSSCSFHHHLSVSSLLFSLSMPPTQFKPSKFITRVCATVESVSDAPLPLTARERRQLRNERRENNLTHNWREEVEEKLMKKPKKRYASWTEELNLDNLAKLGPQWWVVRVSRASGQETAERLAQSLARNFPSIEFKVYAPAIQVKRKLKNGSYSVKPKPLFPGCVFLRSILNKEIHDFIRECDGIGGFIGSKVGNTKRQINKPRPVSDVDIEAIFRQAKEEQEKTDRDFEEQQREETPNPEKLGLGSDLSPSNIAESSVTSKKARRQPRKAVETWENMSSMGKDYKLPVPGSTVRVVSGAFAEFTGTLKEVDHKTGLATVGFTLFGKETLADLNFNDVVLESN